jgi:hypothetical protein
MISAGRISRLMTCVRLALVMANNRRLIACPTIIVPFKDKAPQTKLFSCSIINGSLLQCVFSLSKKKKVHLTSK